MSSQTSPPDRNETHSLELPTQTNRAMKEYYQLQRTLYWVMLTLTGVIFVCVAVTYSLQTAFNYLLGATAGLLYFRRLARDIEGAGSTQGGLSFGGVRIVIFVAVIILAAKLERLSILPVFLGFLTYKAAIVIYVIQTTLFSEQE